MAVDRYTRETRITQVKAMHKLMLNANDENIYMTWIMTGVPDEPMEEDFEYIAEDDQAYNDCVDLFIKLISRKGYRW